jgi:YtcA family
MMPHESIRVTVWPSTIALAATVLAGCDPVVNIAGANFPAWLLCAIIGALGIAILRPVLLFSGLDPYLWWRPGFYSSLGIMVACLVWIIFFNRT